MNPSTNLSNLSESNQYKNDKAKYAGDNSESLLRKNTLDSKSKNMA